MRRTLILACLVCVGVVSNGCVVKDIQKDTDRVEANLITAREDVNAGFTVVMGSLDSVAAVTADQEQRIQALTAHNQQLYNIIASHQAHLQAITAALYKEGIVVTYGTTK